MAAKKELFARKPGGQPRSGKNQLKIARFGQRLRNELSVGLKQALRSISELGWVPPQERVFFEGREMGLKVSKIGRKWRETRPRAPELKFLS